MKKILMGLVLLSMPIMITPLAFADCSDTILAPKTSTAVWYHNNKYHVTKLKCEKFGGNKHWQVPHRRGQGCADTRIDGCSMKWEGVDFKHMFTHRDRKLLTPSCNAHDRCYSTNGMPKEKCDHDFHANLKRVHHKFGGSYSTAAVYAAVLTKKGQKAYRDGQAWGKKHKCFE